LTDRLPGHGRRRLYLRLAAKLLGLTAAGALAFALLAPLFPERAPATYSLDLAHLAPGAVQGIEWSGRRYVVLRRQPAQLTGLDSLEPALVDPRSRHSQQPDGTKGPGRSRTPEFFLALDYDPDFGCPLEYVPVTASAPVSPWMGGFRSPCSGSWFDPAGRVYRGQRATQNLRIPDYRMDGTRLVLVN
jgi:ubiquinol-cytochrome c reductase iron-sulfur subunit